MWTDDRDRTIDRPADRKRAENCQITNILEVDEEAIIT